MSKDHAIIITVVGRFDSEVGAGHAVRTLLETLEPLLRGMPEFTPAHPPVMVMTTEIETEKPIGWEKKE